MIKIKSAKNWQIYYSAFWYRLIDGKYTHLQANTLTNSGTGRIYGDAVGVSAATFNNLEENGVAATLAGRERVDLGVQTLN
ncbi:hypothetical protein WE689_004733, partial [Escherichia coli H10]